MICDMYDMIYKYTTHVKVKLCGKWSVINALYHWKIIEKDAVIVKSQVLHKIYKNISFKIWCKQK